MPLATELIFKEWAEEVAKYVVHKSFTLNIPEHLYNIQSIPGTN